MYLEKKSSNPLYTRWSELRRRCRKPRQASYIRKNIWWSEEFNTFDGFRKWALLNGFREDYSLDRTDNELGYSPENCKWTDKTTQQYNHNKRLVKNSSSIYKGVSYCKNRKKFRARIYIDRKEVLIGYFLDEVECALAYDKYAVSTGLNIPTNFKY